MAEKIVSRFMMTLGADVARQDRATEEILAASVGRRIGAKLLAAMRQRDIEDFVEIVRKGADQVGFDIAFDLVLQDALDRGWAEPAECDMLRAVARNAAAELSVLHRKDDDEYFVTFVVPVHGPRGTLEAAFASGEAGDVLSEALRASGFVTEGVELAFLPSVYDPCEVAACGPATMRYAAASVGVSMMSDVDDDYVRRTAKTLHRRLSDGGAPLLRERIDPEYEIALAVGGYYRKWRPENMTADAMLMSAGKYDDVTEEQAYRRDVHMARCTHRFVEEVSKSAAFGVGVPALSARACSQIAFGMVIDTLSSSARGQGLLPEEATRLDPDDLVYFVDGSDLVVLAKYGDDVAKSMPIPCSLVAGDVEHFRRELGSIHYAARPLAASPGAYKSAAPRNGVPGR